MVYTKGTDPIPNGKYITLICTDRGNHGKPFPREVKVSDGNNGDQWLEFKDGWIYKMSESFVPDGSTFEPAEFDDEIFKFGHSVT